MKNDVWSRRRFISRAAFSALGVFTSREARVLASTECARRFRGRTLRWIVPQPPGGGYDAYSRLIAPFLARRLEARVLVENVVGASGVVGANAIKSAEPDGTTFGMINTPGILLSHLRGDDNTPDPMTDFTILGRVSRSQQVWATGRDSGLLTLDDAIEAARQGPLLFGIQDVASSSFPILTISSSLLGVDAEVIAGYGGTVASCMAALRGEVDLVSFTFESVRRRIEMGELRPLLQISEAPIDAHPSLEDVPMLGGSGGVALKRARALGRDEGKALEAAAALSELTSLGRMLVAPPGLAAEVAGCLDETLYQTLTDSALEEAAARGEWPLHPRRSDATVEALRATAAEVRQFVPLLQEALQRAKG